MMQISEKDVPKCLVCNEIASGVHYGVLTCEGCKGFFRRSITTNACEGNSLICCGNPKNQCNIAYRIRHVCQRCRLQKCFNVGMTRKHSKLGRKRKLHMDVIQASDNSSCNFILSDEEFRDRIKQENKYFLREIGIFSNENPRETKNIDSERIDKSPHICTKDTISINEPEKDKQYLDNLTSFGIHLDSDVLLSPTLTNFWSNPFPILNNESKIHLNDYHGSSMENRNPKSHVVHSLIRINNVEIDQLFNQINNFIHSQNRTHPNYVLFQKFRKLIPKAHMETCNVTIPIMENFFDNKYRNVMVDNDPDSVWNVMIREMEPTTNRILSFCNKLPDFKTVLSFDDAVSVIKLALFDIISIRYLRIVDLDHNQFFDPRLTRKIPADVMAKNPLGPLFLRYFYVAEFIKRDMIDPIDDYEMAYLSALCLTLPGWDSSELKFLNSCYLNKLKFFYCLCLYDHLLVRKYKGNTFETKRRMKRLFTLLDKIKIITKTQADTILAINEKENFVEYFQLILKQI